MNTKELSIVMTFGLILGLCACAERLPVVEPDVKTEYTPYDSDDPAIWVHPTDPAQSIVFGTDKDTQGGVYAFDLDGNIIQEKSITSIKRPNNADIEYGFRLTDSTSTDILVFTEREAQRLRVYSVPDMQPLDDGSLAVFADAQGAEMNLPMGIALYKSPQTAKVYAIVSRKSGPTEGYLYQYELSMVNDTLEMNLVRKFGQFSGKKEIEAIAVDDSKGFIYYSDEGHCIRKYYAEPADGSTEISCFGGEHFKADIEGIAIAVEGDNGYLIVSDQQRGYMNIFDRNTNEYIKAVNLGTHETDGCDVVTLPLNNTFPSGLFAAMNDDKRFFFYDLNRVLNTDIGLDKGE